MVFYISRTDPLEGFSFDIEQDNDLYFPNCQSINEEKSIYCSNRRHRIY